MWFLWLAVLMVKFNLSLCGFHVLFSLIQEIYSEWMNACVAKLSTPTYSTVVSLFTSRVVCGFDNSKMSASLWASKSKKRRSQIKTLLITNRRTSPPNHKLPCSVYSYCRCVQSEIQKIRIFQISQIDAIFKNYI